MGLLFVLAAFQDAAALAERLGADDLETREAAQAALLKLGESAIPALEPHRHNPDLEIRDRARWLLHQLEATSALIDDLRADDISGNAEAARKRLLPRLERDPDRMIPLLTPLASGEDVQAMFYATWLLLRTGHRREAEAACPKLLEKSIRFYFMGRMDDMRWIAAQCVVRLSRDREAAELEGAYGRALKKVRPEAVMVASKALWKTLGEIAPEADRKAYFPDSLVRALAVNLRDDHGYYNEDRVWNLLRDLGERSRPVLIETLASDDRQARSYAAGILIEQGLDPTPDAMIPVLIEREDWKAVEGLGRRSVEWLERAAKGGSREGRLESIRLLFRIDPSVPREEYAPFLAEQLESDQFLRNAERATRAWIEAPPWATARLTALLDSDDPQVVAGAWIALAHRDGAPSKTPPAVPAALEKLLHRSDDAVDEDGLAFELARDGGAEALERIDRLRRCGYRSTERAAERALKAIGEPHAFERPPAVDAPPPDRR